MPVKWGPKSKSTDAKSKSFDGPRSNDGANDGTNIKASSIIVRSKANDSRLAKKTNLSQCGNSVTMGSRISMSQLNATRIDRMTGQKEFWTRQRKVCCLVCSMIVIVFSLSMIFALVALSFVVQPLTTERAKAKFTVYRPPAYAVTEMTFPPMTTDKLSNADVISPSFLCRYHGPKVSFEQTCFYHKLKYVTDCKETQCSHLGVLIDLKVQSYVDGLSRVSASYRVVADNTMWKVKVINNTACQAGGKIGRCVNNICLIRNPIDDDPLKRYSEYDEPEAGLEIAPSFSPEACIIVTNAASPIVDILTKTECWRDNKDCRRALVSVARCNKPHPNKGKNLCYTADSATGLIKAGHDPLIFHQRCDVDLRTCKDKLFHQIKDPELAFNETKCGGLKYTCGYQMYTKGTTNFKLMRDDFTTCCADYIGGHKGYCIAGNCVGYKLHANLMRS